MRLALGTLRSRRGGVLGATAAVTLSAALLASSGIVVESTLRSHPAVDRLAAAAVVVQPSRTFRLAGSQNELALREQPRLDGTLAARLGALRGVERAVADRTFATEISTLNGRAITTDEYPPGHGWASAALTPLTLTTGHAPRHADEVVLDADRAREWGLTPGMRLRIASVASGPKTYEVVGVARQRRGDVRPASAAVFFRDDVAATLSGTEKRVELIGVVARPGADVTAVAARVRPLVEPLGLRVLTGPGRGEAEDPDAVLAREDILAGLSVFGVFGAFAAAFVIASAFALSVRQRSRELALLRAIGATPRQVRRLVAGEALLVAVTGALLAVPLAVAVAVAERWAFVTGGFLPDGFRLVFSPLPFAAGLLAAVVTAQLAALASGRRAARARPVDALREASVEPRPLSRLRGLAGLVALAVGVAVFIGTARDVGGGGGDDAPAAGIVWMLAAVLLGPVLAVPFVVLVGHALERLGGAPGLLARESTRANLRGFASVAAPLLITVSLACALLFSRALVERATVSDVSHSVRATNVVVSSSDGLMPRVAAAARELPGVQHVAGTVGTTVVVDSGGNPEQLPARAIDSTALAAVVNLGIVAGSTSAIRGPSVAVAERRADELGWRLGDRVSLWLGDGTPVRLRVVALLRRPLGFGDVVLPRTVVSGHLSDPLDDAVFVTATAAGDRRLQELTSSHPGAETLNREHYLARVARGVRAESIAVYVILGIVVLFAAIAAANALSMAITDRARELALLRLLGATRRDLRRVVRFEVIIVVTFATAIGALTAAPGIVVFGYGETGKVAPDLPLWMYVAIPCVVAGLALIASVPPTRRALRVGRSSMTAELE